VNRQPSTILPLVLASSSPRRAQILQSLAIPFDVEPARIEELVRGGESVTDAALRIAREKAEDVAPRRPGRWVLAADTLVEIGGAILGKPADRADARRMIASLAGRRHRVATGLWLLRHGEEGRGMVEESGVTMAPMSEEEIAWYAATGEPDDKAGAYALQGLGGRFVEAVHGSWTNVMGLPARGVYRLLRSAGARDLALLAPSSP
jgi:septum formation protein